MNQVDLTILACLQQNRARLGPAWRKEQRAITECRNEANRSGRCDRCVRIVWLGSVAADLPHPQPVYQQAQVGKMRIGKSPIGKSSMGRASIVTKG